MKKASVVMFYIKLIKVKLVQEKNKSMKQIAKVRVNPDLAINQPYLDTNTSKLVENTKAFE